MSPNEARDASGLYPIAQPISLRKHADGSVVVLHDWPPRTMMATSLLDIADTTLVRRVNGHVFFSAANASASYRITHEDTDQGRVWLEYISGNFRAAT